VTLAPGQLHGGYRLVSWRADGGMGEVWRAERDGRSYALKFIREETERDPVRAKEYVKRMELEWRALARIDHPNVVKSVELNLENRPPFLVLEWLEGKPLSEIYTGQGRRPSPTSTIAFVIDALRGLECAHEAGIVHRDIKPSNLFLLDGRVKLIDFGIAASGDATRVTRTDAVAGSLPYFAPERISRPGDPASAQCDVYAMGITLYELLVGELPFSSRNAGELMLMHLHTTMPDIRLKDPSTPAELADIVECATRKDPADRYRDAGQFLEALESFAARNRLSVPPEPVMPPHVGTRVIATEAAFAQALADDVELALSLIGDRRAQRRLNGWLSSVGGPAHTVAFKSLMESVRDSREESWRLQARLIRFFDPNRPIFVGSREIKVTGNAAYLEREVLTALDEELPRLGAEEVEKIGWNLMLALDTRLPARASSFRKLGMAEVIELCWQRDPRRGFRGRDRAALGTLQEVALHFLRQPDSWDEPLLSAERAAFLQRHAPGRSIAGLQDLAYAAFEAEADLEIRFDSLESDDNSYTLRYALDRSLGRFLRRSRLTPGIVKALKGTGDSVCLRREDIPASCRNIPSEVASHLEGSVWNVLGSPRDAPAGWWAFQQSLARATREAIPDQDARTRVVKASAPARGWKKRDLLVGAGLGAAAVLLFLLGARVGIPWHLVGDSGTSPAPLENRVAAAAPDVGGPDVKVPPRQESGARGAANPPRGRDTTLASSGRPLAGAAGEPVSRQRAGTRPEPAGTTGLLIKLPPELAPPQKEPAVGTTSGSSDLPLPPGTPATTSGGQSDPTNPPALPLDGLLPDSAPATHPDDATRYEVKGDTVYDTKTKLTWQRNLSEESMNAGDAKAWCTVKGWRLPTRDETLATLDRSRQPMLDSKAFTGAPVTVWTVSTDESGSRVSVNLRSGTASAVSVNPTYFHVRCVR
jgi:serine/threonine protein kinase